MSEKNQDKRIYIMAEERPAKAVLKMGVPVTMGMLFMVVYNLVDTYFVGLLHDDYQLAATNLSYPVMMIAVAIAGIVGNGGASYIARCIGAGRKDTAEHTLMIGFEMILISGVVLAVVGMLFINPIVNLLGARENTFEYTRDYCMVMFLGAVFTMGNYAIGQLLRSEGSTMYSMIGMIAGTVANIILDPVFIFGLHMQIKGAAIATVLGNVIGVGIFLYFYKKKNLAVFFTETDENGQKNSQRDYVGRGSPYTGTVFTTAAMIVNNNLAAGHGELTVAAMGIANKIMSFGNYVYRE